MVSEQWYFSFLSLRIFYPLIYAYKQIIASPQIFNVFIYFKSSNRSILVDWRFVIFTIEIIHREFASIFSINSIKAITQSIVHNGNPRTFCVLWKSSCLEGYANFKLLSLQMARALNRAFPRFIVFFFFSYLLLRGILPSWREESRFTIHVNGTITLHALKTIIFPRYIFHVHPHVVHHFLESLFIFCTFEKPRGKFIRTIIPFDNRDRSIISNRKFPTRYHRSIVSIPPRYLHLFLHLRSSKLVKKKKEKKYHACGIRQDLRYRLVCKSSSRWHGRTRLARVWQMDRNYQLSPAVSSRLCFW